MAQNASSSAFFLQEPQISRHASTSRIIAEIDVADQPTSQSEECCGIVRLRSLEERSARCVLRLRDGSAVSKNRFASNSAVAAYAKLPSQPVTARQFQPLTRSCRANGDPL